MVTVNANEKQILDLLSTILEKYCYDDEYSLEGYSENSICIEKEDDSAWEVYCGERNNHYSSETASNIYDACMIMIRKVGKPEDVPQMENLFSGLINGNPPKQTRTCRALNYR